MKLLVVFAALFAVALAVPVEHVEHHGADIVNQKTDVQPDGYSYLLDTSDGTHKDEVGELKDAGSEHEHIVVHGSYSWVDEKTGKEYVVKYVADENGFQPEGEHLPKA